MQKLNNPHLNLPPVIHVAGTNGKGSTASLIAKIFQCHGYKAHLYTSPHLLSWCERIRLPDGLITETELRRLLQELQPLALRRNLTPFELVTAAAFVAFAEAGVELAVLEVNAQCGLSEDENYTSIGAILRYAGQSFAGLIGEIVDDALARRGVPHVSRPAPPARAGAVERSA